MPVFRNKQTFFIIGLLAITAVYFLYNVFLVDVDYYLAIPRKWRHVNKFGSILIVYGIGTWALKKYTVSWMMQIWHLVYVVILCILLLIGFYDWSIGIISFKIRNIASSLHELLISPVFYVVMGIINSRIPK